MSTRTHAQLADLVSALVEGWVERVEYSVPTCVHTPVCIEDQALLTSAMLKHFTCMCPLRLERRVNRVRQASLLDQLTGEANGYAPTLSGGRGSKPGSKPPATLDMLDLLASIDWFLVVMDADGKTRVDKLRNLVSRSMTLNDGEWTHHACSQIRRFIKTARIMLHYDVPSRVLRDVVCGECGGRLVVAIDATSDVRCVGPDDGVSCGQVYVRYSWVDLLERDERA